MPPDQLTSTYIISAPKFTGRGASADPVHLCSINTQMLSNAFNNLDNSWLFGQWWNGPWNVTTAGPKTQISALAMLASAVVADVAFNAELQSAGAASQ